MDGKVKKLVLAMAAAGLMTSGYAFAYPHNPTTSLDCNEAHGGAINQNVDVFPGSTCTLTAVNVTGNVTVWGGGTLRFCGTNTVQGNVSVTNYIDGVEFAPGSLYVGCEGQAGATLNINPSENHRGAGNLSCLASNLGSDRNDPGLNIDTVSAHGNVSVVECDNPRALIDIVNTFTITGPNGKQQKGNLFCLDNANPSFGGTGTIQGAVSGDGSCLD